jgi:hypothetical protein
VWEQGCACRGPDWGHAGRAVPGAREAAWGGAKGPRGDHAQGRRRRPGGARGGRKGGRREERGAHLGIRRSAATIHRITPRAKEVEEREREVVVREKKMR